MITNIVNNMKYIGRSKHSGSLRLLQLFSAARELTQYDRPIFEDMRLHTLESYTVTVLQIVAPEEANERERYWIKYYNTIWPEGLNLESGGVSGKAVHQQTIVAMSSKLKSRYAVHTHPSVGRVQPDDYKQMMSSRMSGSSNPMYGKTHSADSLTRNRQSNRNKYSKPVILSTDAVSLEFDSQYAAANYLTANSVCTGNEIYVIHNIVHSCNVGKLYKGYKCTWNISA